MLYLVFTTHHSMVCHDMRKSQVLERSLETKIQNDDMTHTIKHGRAYVNQIKNTYVFYKIYLTLCARQLIHVCPMKCMMVKEINIFEFLSIRSLILMNFLEI